MLITQFESTFVIDKIFFKEGSEFNQGNIYTFDDDEFTSAMEKAELYCKKDNTKGKLLKEKFTYKKTLDDILSKIESKK